jgi:hypothetical protein
MMREQMFTANGLVREWAREEWAARDSNPARRIKSPELYQMS